MWLSIGQCSCQSEINAFEILLLHIVSEIRVGKITGGKIPPLLSPVALLLDIFQANSYHYQKDFTMTDLPAHTHEERGECNLFVIEPLQHPEGRVVDDVIQVHLIAVLRRYPAEDETDFLELRLADADQLIDQ